MQCELVFFFDKTVPFMSRISRYYLVKLFYDLASKIVIVIQLLELYLILNKVWMRQVSVVNLFPGSLFEEGE